jgi:hypothetical protein
MTQEALKLALDALKKCHYYMIDAGLPNQSLLNEVFTASTAIKEALREHAMREVQRLGQEIEQEQECWCTTCRPISMADMRFVVCPDCGNKRCPKANDHCNDCTNSNEVGQKGSSWEHVKPLAQPEQDHIPDARKMVTEQEPVVGIAAIRTWFKDGRVVTQTLCNSWVDTTPPQRTWVDLTDEEYTHITDSVYHQGHGLVAYYKAIEAKLKELNT